MNKIDRQNEHFDTISEQYYKARQCKNHLMYKKLLFGYMLSDLAPHIKKKPTVAVLEPMCGYGEGCDIIRSYLTDDFEYEGFDYNDTLISKVKRKYPDINIYKQDVTTFNTDKKYDIVILIGGLHHVPDYAEKVVSNIFFVLRRGGFFINFEPTQGNQITSLVRKAIYKKNRFFDEQTEHGFLLNRLNAIYRDAGFKKFKQFYPGLLGYILYYNPDAFPLLNIGNEKFVKAIFNAEKKLYASAIGRVLSFTTFSILIKK